MVFQEEDLPLREATNKPQYRLRVDDVRVFYDVTDKPEPRIEVLAVVPKKEAVAWLEREGLKS